MVVSVKGDSVRVLKEWWRHKGRSGMVHRLEEQNSVIVIRVEGDAETDIIGGK